MNFLGRPIARAAADANVGRGVCKENYAAEGNARKQRDRPIARAALDESVVRGMSFQARCSKCVVWGVSESSCAAEVRTPKPSRAASGGKSS